MSTRDRILCIDDDEDHCSLLEATLKRFDYEVVTTTDPRTALELVANKPFDAIITDLGMGEMDGLLLCERILEMRPEVPIVVLTGGGTLETAIGALRAGAYDFLTKPVDNRLLGISVARAVQHSKIRAEVTRLSLQAGSKTKQLIGDSPAMGRLNELIARVAGSDVSVVIRGATGTGKELVARALHQASARRHGPFVALNCAAVPAALLESELFGHVRGAFTDAKTARQGLFVESSGGTLFLDEIGEMPLDMQAKLLRVLQERKVRPVGGSAEVDFDARILTATHRDLEADVRAGSFREDLFYRINVVNIPVPALCDRGRDILTLAAHFARSFGERSNKGHIRLSTDVAARLMAYAWPGNVRELENCIEHAIAVARFDQLTVEDLPDAVRAYRADRLGLGDDSDEILPIEEVERRYMLRVLEQLDGNKTRAAKLLGLDRRTFHRKLAQFEASAELDPPKSGPAESILSP